MPLLLGAMGTSAYPRSPVATDGVRILYPANGTLFPSDIRSPEVLWADSDPTHRAWIVRISFRDARYNSQFPVKERRWTPSRNVWERVKEASVETPASLEVCGESSANGSPAACSSIRFTTSQDAVGAPIFFRAVPNPFPRPQDFVKVKWKLAWVSSYDTPVVVMKDQPKCFNCHATSFDGKSLGFVYRRSFRGFDRAGYLFVKNPGKKVAWQWSDYFNWNEGLPSPDRNTHYALFSTISPDGNFVVTAGRALTYPEATPHDMISYAHFTESSIYFYSYIDKTVMTLPGGADDRFIRVPTSWSPDGKDIFFSRAPSTAKIKGWNLHPLDEKVIKLQQKMGWRELDKIYPLKYDIYRIPFNGGKGGQETPVLGASHNGKSNYFARISPDGKWLVFAQSANGIFLMRMDSRLYIVPAGGGQARELGSNAAGANSWHSWSPNSRWLVFSSKASAKSQTDLVLTHIDENGNDSPRVVLAHLRDEGGLSANLPEFLNIRPGQLDEIDPHGVYGDRPATSARNAR